MNRTLTFLTLLLLLTACGGNKRPSHYQYGNQYFDAGDYQDAARHYDLAWTEKKQPQALFNLGLTQLKLEDFKAAVTTYERYLALNANDWEAHVNLGHALAGTGDNKAAMVAFEAGVDLNSTWPEPYCAYGGFLLAQYHAREFHELDKIKALADQAITLGKESSNAWLFHGKVAMAMGESDAAMNSYAEAVKRDQHNVEAHMKLAGLHVKQGEWSEAQRLYRSVSDAEHNLFALLGLGRCYLEMGEYALAQEVLNRAVRKMPQNQRALNLLFLTNLSAATHNLSYLRKGNGIAIDLQKKTEAVAEELKKMLAVEQSLSAGSKPIRYKEGGS